MKGELEIPTTAYNRNLRGIVTECRKRTWVEGFVKGFCASRGTMRGHSVREDIVESTRSNKLYSHSVFYIERSGVKVYLAMWYPKDGNLFYLT